jgi:hypothetical protein
VLSLRGARFSVSCDGWMTWGRRFVYKKDTYAWNVAWNTKTLN